jgi:hypothetical protein
VSRAVEEANRRRWTSTSARSASTEGTPTENLHMAFPASGNGIVVGNRIELVGRSRQ